LIEYATDELIRARTGLGEEGWMKRNVVCVSFAAWINRSGMMRRNKEKSSLNQSACGGRRQAANKRRVFDWCWSSGCSTISFRRDLTIPSGREKRDDRVTSTHDAERERLENPKVRNE
jgi:hypothetical protein